MFWDLNCARSAVRVLVGRSLEYARTVTGFRAEREGRDDSKKLKSLTSRAVDSADLVNTRALVIPRLWTRWKSISGF